jgi:hypothetical protein
VETFCIGLRLHCATKGSQVVCERSVCEERLDFYKREWRVDITQCESDSPRDGDRGSTEEFSPIIRGKFRVHPSASPPIRSRADKWV